MDTTTPSTAATALAQSLHAPSHRFRRLLAVAVDFLFLTLIFLLFYPLSGVIEKLDPWPRLVTALLTCLYFAIFESGERVTLGRKIFSLELARLNQKPISFSFAFARTVLLLFPVYFDVLTGLMPSTNALDTLHLMSAMLLEISYVLVPLFHPQGRTIPDLVFKTWVHTRKEHPVAGPRRWSDTSKVICVVTATAISALFTFMFLTMLEKIGPTKSQTPVFVAISEKIQNKIHRDVPTVGYAQFIVNGRMTMSALDAVVVVPTAVYRDDLQREVLKSQIFPIMKQELPADQEVDTLRIQFLSRRYLGLLSLEMKKYESKKVVDVDVAAE